MSIYQEQADLFCTNLNLRTFTELGIEFEPFELPDDASLSNVSGPLNSFWGLTHTEDSKEKMSSTWLKNWGAKHFTQSETWKEQARENGRFTRIGELNSKHMKEFWENASEETTKSQTAAGLTNMNSKIKCPHCPMVANKGNIARHHGDNCKHRKV